MKNGIYSRTLLASVLLVLLVTLTSSIHCAFVLDMDHIPKYIFGIGTNGRLLHSLLSFGILSGLSAFLFACISAALCRRLVVSLIKKQETIEDSEESEDEFLLQYELLPEATWTTC